VDSRRGLPGHRGRRPEIPPVCCCLGNRLGRLRGCPLRGCPLRGCAHGRRMQAPPGTSDY
jgi:hypothetical protein